MDLMKFGEGAVVQPSGEFDRLHRIPFAGSGHRDRSIPDSDTCMKRIVASAFHRLC